MANRKNAGIAIPSRGRTLIPNRMRTSTGRSNSERITSQEATSTEFSEGNFFWIPKASTNATEKIAAVLAKDIAKLARVDKADTFYTFFIPLQ